MKTKRKYRGLAPRAGKVKEMQLDGYGTPGAVAKQFEISNQTVYAWVRDGRLEPIGGKPAAKKVGANVWVLFASVERRLTISTRVAS